MFSRRKPNLPKGRNNNLSQFGLTDIPDDFDTNMRSDDGNEDDDDSDLEAELAAISAGVSRSKPKPKEKINIVLPNELDEMIAKSMKDVGTDDEDNEDAGNDMELLSELRSIVGDVEVEESDTCIQSKSIEPDSKNEIVLPKINSSTLDIIKKRIEMYKIAEANAKSASENAKARRFNRGIKTLNDLLKQAISGKTIDINEIPPEISVKPAAFTSKIETEDNQAIIQEPHKIPEPEPLTTKQVETKHDDVSQELLTPASHEVNPTVQQMRSRQQEYKDEALKSKRSGDTTMALQFLKIVKQFDVVIKMYEDGQFVDLSDMPPAPDQFKEFMENMVASAEQKSGGQPQAPLNTSTLQSESVTSNATNVLDALQQRLIKYKSVEESAQSEGNTSKARRFGRIVKQYEDAIKSYKAGRPVAYDELPVPPGFGPLPVDSKIVSMPSKIGSEPSISSISSTPNSTLDPDPTVSITNLPSPIRNFDLTTRTSGNQQKNNLAETQMKILLERQKEFKVAAIEAKKAGEIDQAKEYLKIYKGFDALLNAASSGLPVDLNTLPVPPSESNNLESLFAIITTEECDPNDDISDIGVRIEEQLAKQLMMCKNTRDHHKAMGDIAGMNRFENLALNVQKDLDLVRYSKRKNFSLPKFHYEQRSFNIVHCNTDLSENELEITVVCGINYNVDNPKEVDTYVKIEFPLPNDEMFKTKTNLVKDTDSPDYNQRFTVEIMRGNRQFQRIFKRHGIKFEVYSRGGFLRSDTLVGTVNVKLQPLETKCDIHDTFDLLKGRKKVGGKLEIKLRVRNPILTKQMEHITEKWLVIDT